MNRRHTVPWRRSCTRPLANNRHTTQTHKFHRRWWPARQSCKPQGWCNRPRVPDMFRCRPWLWGCSSTQWKTCNLEFHPRRTRHLRRRPPSSCHRNLYLPQGSRSSVVDLGFHVVVTQIGATRGQQERSHKSRRLGLHWGWLQASGSGNLQWGCRTRRPRSLWRRSCLQIRWCTRAHKRRGKIAYRVYYGTLKDKVQSRILHRRIPLFLFSKPNNSLRTPPIKGCNASPIARFRPPMRDKKRGTGFFFFSRLTRLNSPRQLPQSLRHHLHEVFLIFV